ncbi:MAG: GGDEF domain-containing protein, partial [Lysinibacillus sp.]
GIVLYASPSYSSSLGYDNVELLGKFYGNLVSRDSMDIWHNYLNNLEHRPDDKFELLLQSKEDSLHWTEANVTVVKDPNRKIVSQIIIVSREITHRKKIENDLLFMAYHDSLTQLPNRRYLLKEFPRLLAEAIQNKLSMAVLYIDGDDFKQINDNYGHDVGDEFISNFGKVLSSSIRSHDLIVRVGGDEFIVVLTGLNCDSKERKLQVTQIIERIRKGLKLGWNIEQFHFAPTASVGISFYPDHADTLDELIDLADQALYEAKSRGNDRLHITKKDRK